MSDSAANRIPTVESGKTTLEKLFVKGAIWTVLTNESQLGPGIPLIHIVVLTIILRARWSARWKV